METKTFEEILNETGYFFYKSIGISMRPLIYEGRDFIIIRKRPTTRLKKYDVVLFRKSDSNGYNRYVLHRILKVNPNGTYWIVGDNCIRGDTVKEENIIGVLTEIKRKGKIIHETDFFYRLYIYLWCAPYPMRFLLLGIRRLCGRIK